MTGATDVPFRFTIGSRTLASINRRLVVRSLSLDDALSDAVPALPPLAPSTDGYLIRSLPEGRDFGEWDAARWISYVRDRFPRYYARLDKGIDAYLAGFSGSARSTLKRKLRRFEQLSGGVIDVREYRTPAEMNEFHSLAREISRTTYQERLLDAGLPDTSSYRAEMEDQARRGAARGYLLFLDGEPISYLYTPVEDGVAIYAYLGYHPSQGRHSPGTVLQFEALRRLIADPAVRLFDFTEGDGQHKRQFATAKVDCRNILILNATPANRLLVALHRSFNGSISRLRDQAERYGIRGRLNRLLRR